MENFLFAMGGLTVGLAIGIYRTGVVYRACIVAGRSLLKEYIPKQKRDKNGRFISKVTLMTEQLKTEVAQRELSRRYTPGVEL